jgi:hypothetical protein
LVDFLSTTAVVVFPSAETLATVQTFNVLPETVAASNLTSTSVSFGNLFTTLHSESLTAPTVVTVADPEAPLKTLPH